MPNIIEIQGLGAVSPKARKFVQAKIRKLVRDEGYPPRQAVAIAFNMARKKGYKVPRAPRVRSR